MFVAQYSPAPTGNSLSSGLPTTTYADLGTGTSAQVTDYGAGNPEAQSFLWTLRPEDWSSIGQMALPDSQSPDRSNGDEAPQHIWTHDEVRSMFAAHRLDSTPEGDNQSVPEPMDFQYQFPQEQLSIDQSSHPSPITPKIEKKDGQINDHVSQPHKSLEGDLQYKTLSHGENRTERLPCTVCTKSKVKCVYIPTRMRCQKCYDEHKKCYPSDE
jgi:hypothetical protein